ncbi:MAG: AAA family ATPase [Polyangia bacterium]
MGSYPSKKATVEPITRIRVAGFKSIAKEQEIEVRPLTILAGGNSSGKSSMMQPLLLLKQTLEASFDPGPLLLIGGHLKFTSNDQVLSRINRAGPLQKQFLVGFGNENDYFSVRFQAHSESTFAVNQWTYQRREHALVLEPAMSDSEVLRATKEYLKAIEPKLGSPIVAARLTSMRCLADLRCRQKDGNFIELSLQAKSDTTSIIHLPVVRGSSDRGVPIAAVGDSFVGTFPVYTASILERWQDTKDLSRLTSVYQDLKHLGLTSKVVAHRKNGAELEVLVARQTDRSPRGPRDLVSLVDVGFGVSQVLPVLVALHVAKPGQLVYIEQPENDLHPRAQFALAHVLAAAARRGVRLVLETHSSLLLLGIQTLVAEGELDPALVKLHWFTRSAKDGATTVSSADLDESGAFGEDWPIDFAHVELQAQSRYLDAAEARQSRRKH